MERENTAEEVPEEMTVSNYGSAQKLYPVIGNDGPKWISTTKALVRLYMLHLPFMHRSHVD